MSLTEYEQNFVYNAYDVVMAEYSKYTGLSVFESDHSNYVLDEFLAEVTDRLRTGNTPSANGVIVRSVVDHLIYFGVAEIDFYDFMRGHAILGYYIDNFESLVKHEYGIFNLARHMLNDILENGENGMWNDYYEAFFSNCYHYNDYQLSRLSFAINNLYRREFAMEGVLERHVGWLLGTLEYGVNR